MKRAKLAPATRARRSEIQPIGLAPAGKGPKRVYLTGAKGHMNESGGKFRSLRISPKVRRKRR